MQKECSLQKSDLVSFAPSLTTWLSPFVKKQLMVVSVHWLGSEKLTWKWQTWSSFTLYMGIAYREKNIRQWAFLTRISRHLTIFLAKLLPNNKQYRRMTLVVQWCYKRDNLKSLAAWSHKVWNTHLVWSMFSGYIPTDQLAQWFPNVSPSMLALRVAIILMSSQ